MGLLPCKMRPKSQRQETDALRIAIEYLLNYCLNIRIDLAPSFRPTIQTLPNNIERIRAADEAQFLWYRRGGNSDLSLPQILL